MKSYYVALAWPQPPQRSACLCLLIAGIKVCTTSLASLLLGAEFLLWGLKLLVFNLSHVPHFLRDWEEIAVTLAVCFNLDPDHPFNIMRIGRSTLLEFSRNLTEDWAWAPSGFGVVCEQMLGTGVTDGSVVKGRFGHFSRVSAVFGTGLILPCRCFILHCQVFLFFTCSSSWAQLPWPCSVCTEPHTR